MHQTSIVCAYILADVKKYVDGCGGDSDIIQLAHTGSWKTFPGEDDLEQIEDIEKGYETWKEKLSSLMVAYQDFNVSQLTFESDLTDACESLTAQRKQKADFHDDLERMELERKLAELKEHQEGSS
jgi:hypothetical protein